MFAPASPSSDILDVASPPLREDKLPEDKGPRSEGVEQLEEGDTTPNAKSDAPAEPSNDTPPLSAEPPLPTEPVLNADGPPLPKEPVPQDGDGWEAQWDAASQAWFFFNRLTGISQWDNPRVPDITTKSERAPGTEPTLPKPPSSEKPPGGGYNPAIHGDYDPNAWYAQGYADPEQAHASPVISSAAEQYTITATFNRFTGQFQSEDMGPSRHTDEAKSRRQMNAFFDVDAAANTHDGRSLKAERSGKKISKTELKAFKEKRKARKEEKRRAWLRD